MSRNPDWTDDELIVALDLYFRCGRKWVSYTHADVIALSQLLNQLPIHDAQARDTDFRNPRSVSMKLSNFLSLDPHYQGRGLSRGSKRDKAVWDEFSNDIYRLVQTAAAISKNTTQIAETGGSYSADDEETFPEGRILTRLHKQKERNRKVVEQKKRKVLQETSRLLCEVCDFDFAKTYGNLGYGFAECHHIVPIAQLDEQHHTRLADLAIVCANCHRMIHKSRPMLTTQELRAIVKHNTV
jgi:5-methylcytosine-specific restriction enzyme A